MKNRVKIISKKDYYTWIDTANLFAKSIDFTNEALSEFNRCKAYTRKEIRKTMLRFDDLRRKIIPTDLSKEEVNQAFELSVFVDLHIIATDYDILPLTAALCINPPCKDEERIMVK